MSAQFIDIEMPEEFVLESLTPDGGWIDWGLYRAGDFERGEDGLYVAQGFGSPLWLRCLRQDGSVIHVVDGAGAPFTYRLVPFPSEKYQAVHRWPAVGSFIGPLAGRLSVVIRRRRAGWFP